MPAGTSSKLIVAVGLPGSGKSARLPAAALSSDRLRLELSGNEADQRINSRVFAELRKQAAGSVRVNPVTWIDATNLTRRERRQWILLARENGASVEAWYFDVPLAVCKARNAARTRVVPERVLNQMAARLVPPSLQEGFNHVEVLRPLPEKPVHE